MSLRSKKIFIYCTSYKCMEQFTSCAFSNAKFSK